MDEKQREQFRKAVEEKEQAAAASAQAHEEQLQADGESPDTPDPRTKSSGHKKKTADKWNQ
jgi:hypothetical protein